MTTTSTERSPWPALFALVVGFFMILLDMTIVSVANPAIMAHLHTGINNVIWVTSAYLLTYAVPLLITGRLGDRYGPKNLYLAGLAVFTLASLACGLSGGIVALIAARAVQGLGAALMTPQTMAVITRIFPADKRGTAMGLWGGVAGLASLVGPILGGILVDNLGWEWIFFVNVPVGLVAFVLAVRLVPTLPTHAHRFDIVGVLLSGVGMTVLVFGIQEGNSYHWAGWVWGMILAGIVVLVAFIVHQLRNSREPLVPMSLFRDRNFSLSNLAITAMGASVTALMLPVFFYLEAVRDLSPTRAALVMAPMAVLTGVIAPFAGRISDRMDPKIVPTIGFVFFAASVAWLALVMKPETSIAMIVLPFAVMGASNACIWSPLAATATRNLNIAQAGAGAGVYNTTRQVGSVLGSAAVSALITSRMVAHGFHGTVNEGSTGAGRLPRGLADAFSSALAESVYLPAIVLLVGVVASGLFIRSARRTDPAPQSQQLEPTPAGS